MNGTMMGLALMAATLTGAVDTAETTTQETTSQVAETTQDAGQAAKDTAEGILSQFFDAQTVAMIMSWVAYAGTIIGLAVKLRSLASRNQLTTADVRDAVIKAVDGKVSESVKSEISDVLEKVVAKEDDIKSLTNKLVQAVMLMQEDTVDSRLALLKLLSETGADVSEAVKAVEDEAAEEKKNKEEATAELEAIENAGSADDGTSI